jgi:asparagine synthase (glutamine-hydrolysing)
MKKFFHDMDITPAITYENFMSCEELRNRDGIRTKWPVFDKQHFTEKNLYLALSRDRKEYLVDDILQMNDQVSLYHGIEMRSPYLDDELVDFARRIDPLILLKHGRKWMLKKILSEQGLSRIARRSKEGFGFPVGKWIREKQFRYLTDNLIEKDNPLFSFIDYNRTRKIIQNHLDYLEDHSSAIFTLMVLTEWLKRF